MFEQDYIVRQLRTMTESIARAVDLAERDDWAQVEADLDDAYRQLLPMDRVLFETLDARSLLPLLGDPERIAAATRLQLTEANLRLNQKYPGRAARCLYRASVFLEHLVATPNRLKADEVSTLQAKLVSLRRKLPPVREWEPNGSND